MINSNNFALSLSGGGLSALAYASFVEELKKHQLEPSCYAGLSGGALLSVLLASNLSTQEIVDLIRHLKTLKLLNTHLTQFEIIDHKKLTELIRDLLPIKFFEQLPKRAVVFASDLNKKETAVLSSGDIASAVVASCSLFPVLKPVKRKGLLLGDGGFTVYYGAQYLHDMGFTKVIGVDVTGLTEGTFKGILKAFYQLVNSAISSNARYELHEAPVNLDIKITFPSPTIFTIERKINHILYLGRKAAERNIKKIKKILANEVE